MVTISRVRGDLWQEHVVVACLTVILLETSYRWLIMKSRLI
jgi:hypothetical protein